MSDLPPDSDFVHVSGRSSTEISMTGVEDSSRNDDTVSRTSAKSDEPENDKKDDQPFNVGAQMAMMVAQRVLNPSANKEDTSIAKVEDVKFGFFDETDVNHTGDQSDVLQSRSQTANQEEKSIAKVEEVSFGFFDETNVNHTPVAEVLLEPQVNDVVDFSIESEQPVPVQVSEPSLAPKLSLVENEKPILSHVSISDPPADENKVEAFEQSSEDGEIIDDIMSAAQHSVETTTEEPLSDLSKEARIKQWIDKEESIRVAAPDLWSPDNEQGRRVYDREFMMLICVKKDLQRPRSVREPHWVHYYCICMYSNTNQQEQHFTIT